MKKGLFSILTILGIICLLISCKHNLNIYKKNQFADRFVADSGYILKKEGIAFLLQIKDTAAVNVKNSTFKNSDTIGKYYKTKTGNYIACILDIIHPVRNASPVLIEYTPKGKIINTENYYGGMYLCCWKNNYEGFKKLGDYYSIKTCGTGSGFCGGNINVFKELEPQLLYDIPTNTWSSLYALQAEGPALACSMTSTIYGL